MPGHTQRAKSGGLVLRDEVILGSHTTFNWWSARHPWQP